MNEHTWNRTSGRTGWMAILVLIVVTGTETFAQSAPSVASVVPPVSSATIVEAIGRARSSGEDPMAAVIRSLSVYPNAQVSGADVRAALAALNVDAEEGTSASLQNLDRIVKTGNLITISNSAESTVKTGSATIKFGKTVKAKLTANGSSILLENIEGVSVSAGLSGGIRRLEFFKNDAGDPMLRATARVLGFNTTREINLREVKEKADAERREREGSNDSSTTTTSTSPSASERLNDINR
ncbi:MAG: hypothetical protein HYZ53_22845 [Planctomycetes bacterium]|nr:hypothetical protein [Planctomycetota bacterium]